MCPLIEELPIEVDEPLQIEVELPVLNDGIGLTVTLTESVFEQPVEVFVSVNLYSVVTVGLTDGFALLEVYPLGLLVQLYVRPATDAAPMEVEEPLHTDVAEAIPTVGAAFIVIVCVVESLQPFAFVSISFTDPLPLAFHLMVTVSLLAPDTIVPPVTFQLCELVEVPATYCCVVALHNVVVPVMDATGLVWMVT